LTILLNSRRSARYRRISNEDELASSLRSTFPRWLVVQENLGHLPMPEQVARVTDADVIVGMHGAGLCLIMLHGRATEVALLELFRSRSDVRDHRHANTGEEERRRRWISRPLISLVVALCCVL
jgi:capsular polysaccharide biosynthesis protein